MRRGLIILTVLVLIVMVIALVACDKSTNTTTTISTPSINRNYNYTKCSYRFTPNGSTMTVSITGWRLDESGALELTLTDGNKELLYCESWLLHQ